MANHALSGRAVIDTTCTATTTPVWFGTGWNQDLLDHLGVKPECLPDVVDLGGAAGTLTGSDVVLGAGSIDAMGEQIVSGAEDPGDVLVILGTTLIVWAAQGGWPEVPGFWTIPSMTSGAALVGGPSDAGGLFLDWVRRLVGDGEPGERASLDPASVPTWAPWPRGERVPLHDRRLRARLDDVDLTHGPAAVRRAAFEASAHMVRLLIEGATGGGISRVRRIVVTGGGVRVDGWVQAIADVCGRPVETVGVPEGGALGSAWFARMAAGLETSMTDAPRWASRGATVEPDNRWEEPAAARHMEFRAAIP
jgi:xylulokinase